jgi:RND superfamily putative drug exporter
MIAMKRIGEVFKESNSDSIAMILLEGDKPLGDDAHKYYNALIRKLEEDSHVQHVQDFWGDSLTAAGAQSPDGKAAYVQVSLAGNQGENLANKSVEAIRQIVAKMPPPSGVKTFVTGPSALVTDMHYVGDESLIKITVASIAVIFIMLLLVYRSAITVILLLLTVGLEFAASRGIVALLGSTGAIGLSTFAVNLLTALTIAAGTDYGIFLLGRYQEARQAGQDREAAYYTAWHGVTHVIVGSGLTIAGGIFCLSFTRLPYFQSMGVPSAVGMLVAVAVALTLGPAVLSVGSRVGLFDPKRTIQTRG